MKIVRAATSGLAFLLASTVVQAAGFEEAAESVSGAGSRGILLILQEPDGGYASLIESLKPSAAQIYVGIGNNSGVSPISGERHDEIVADFEEAGFNVCTSWGRVTPDYDLLDVMRQEVAIAIDGGAGVAFLVDHGEPSLAGLEYQPPADEGSDPFVGAKQTDDGDEMFIGAEGKGVEEDTMFARLHFLAANFMQGANMAGCLTG